MALANPPTLGRTWCVPLADPIAPDELPSRELRGRWAIRVPQPPPEPPATPPRPLVLGVMGVRPSTAAPGEQLEVQVQIDDRLHAADLTVSIGGCARSTFELTDRHGSELAMLRVRAPVLHDAGPWLVQLHARGVSSPATPHAELRIRVQRSPTSPMSRQLERSASAERISPAQRALQLAEQKWQAENEHRHGSVGLIESWDRRANLDEYSGMVRPPAADHDDGSGGVRHASLFDPVASAPLIMPALKHAKLVLAAAEVTRQRSTQLDRRYEQKPAALLTKGPVVMRGLEEFHLTMVQLHREAVAVTGGARSGGGAGKPPTTAESERAFHHADADADGVVTLDEFVEAQRRVRELHAQAALQREAAQQDEAEARRRRHTVASLQAALPTRPRVAKADQMQARHTFGFENHASPCFSPCRSFLSPEIWRAEQAAVGGATGCG